MRRHALYILFILTSAMFAQSPFQMVRGLTAEENYKRAADVLDSCQRYKFYNDSALYYLGILHLKTGEVSYARKTCRQLLKSYPGFKMAHYLNSLVYFSETDYGRCIDELNEVLKDDPVHFNALYNRSLAFGMLEDYLLAIDDLGKCIELKPGYSPAYFCRAYWYEYTGNYAEAAKDYQTTINLDPKNYDAYLGLAFTYQVQNNPARACEIINSAIAAGSQIAVDLKVNYCR